MNLNKKILIPIVVGLLLGTSIAGSVAYAKIAYHGRYYPGTKIAGVDVSRMTGNQAKDLIQPKLDQYLSEPLLVRFKDSEVEILPGDLGVEIHLIDTLNSIDEINGKEVDILNFIQVLGDPKEERDLGLVVSINNQKLEDKLDEVFQLESLRPKSASFRFENNKLVIEDSASGIVISEEDLLEQLKNSARKLKRQTIDLKFSEESPLITRELLEAQEDQVKEAIRHRFTLVDPVYADNWDLSLAEHLDWVEFVQLQEVEVPLFQTSTLVSDNTKLSEEEPLIGIKINQIKLNEFIDSEIAQWLDRPPENVNISQDDQGNIKIEGKGKDGIKLQRSMLKSAIELAIENRVKDVPIPVLTIEPQVTISPEVQAMGITDRIAVGHTSYYGSPTNRVHNIKTAADRFNGVVIAPEEVFSFNNWLGVVDGSTGYRKELVIKPEGTIPEFGGGICQVSTTFYRAMLMGAFPIVERHPHSYAVSYYAQILGHGLDATIYLGGPDLKFQNDTGGHLLVQAFVENDYELYFVFYGTPSGKTVSLEGPYLSNYHNPGATQYIETSDLEPGATKQVEKAHTGFNALWYRHITDSDGAITVEPLQTKYKAVPNKIMVGIDPSSQS